MSMSDPLLPVPDADPEPGRPDGEEEFERVEDEPQPDVLPPSPDSAPADPVPADDEHPDFVTPRAGDRLSMDELQQDLEDE